MDGVVCLGAPFKRQAHTSRGTFFFRLFFGQMSEAKGRTGLGSDIAVSTAAGVRKSKIWAGVNVHKSRVLQSVATS